MIGTTIQSISTRGLHARPESSSRLEAGSLSGLNESMASGACVVILQKRGVRPIHKRRRASYLHYAGRPLNAGLSAGMTEPPSRVELDPVGCGTHAGPARIIEQSTTEQRALARPYKESEITMAQPGGGVPSRRSAPLSLPPEA